LSIGFQEILATAVTDGTAITNTTTRTSMTAATTSARYTLAGNRLRIGDQFELFAQGRISTVVTTPGNITIDLAIGATLLFSTLAMPLNVVAKTNVSWELHAFGTVRAIGTTGNIFWGGWWLSEASILVPLPATGPGPGGQNVPYNTAPVVGSNFDTTIANLIDLNATFSVANAANSIQLHQYRLGLTSRG
jgi:hypothetical protein